MAETFTSSHGHRTELVENPNTESCEFCVLPKSAAYRCIECHANLCGDCFSMPQEIPHGFYQGHVLRLTLIPKLSGPTERFPNHDDMRFLICKGCHYISLPRGLYRCDKCEFCLCVECGISRTRKIPLGWKSNEGFRHWSDVHQLVRCRFREYSLVVEKVRYECRICELSMWGTGYACPDFMCYKFIHESCIDTPRIMHHPLHPHHPFTLRKIVFEWIFKSCEVCGQENAIRKLTTYNCDTCSFALHFQCAISALRQIKLGSHEHSLTGVLTDNFLKCYICDRRIKNHGLRCVECRSYFHVECVSVPREWKHKYHEHKLNLMDGMKTSDYIQSEYPCDICEGMIKDATKVYVYGCKLCNFYAHFECALSKKDESEECSSSLWLEDYDQTVETNDSIGPSIKKIKEAIYDHSLRLQNGNNKLCGVCKLQINGQAYACDDDDAFWVHEECAELPQTLTHHPLHPFHELHFLSRSFFRIFLVCDVCGEIFLGFHFYCRSCHFVIHVKCAFLSNVGQTFYDKHGGKSLEHPFHPEHEMTLVNCSSDLDIWCLMCGKTLSGPSYVCKRCILSGITSHKACMEWPVSVEGHPTAPHHLLQLCQTDSWSGSPPQCFACGDVMARYGYKAVDKERGMFNYHVECGTSLARPFKRTGLPHLLYYVHIRPSKSIGAPMTLRCAFCGERLSDRYYRCLKCSLCFHITCLRQAKWLPSTAIHEHHVHLLSFKEECIDYGGYYCDICEEPRDPQHPCYACDGCEFVVHIECLFSEENASNVTLEEIQRDDGVKIRECS